MSSEITNEPCTCDGAVAKGIDDGDPVILDMMPAPLSGEWAGCSIREIFGRIPSSREMDLYESAYSDVYWREIERACAAALEPSS